MNKSYQIKCVEELEQIADDLIANYPNGTTILLEGDLGSGKSSLVYALANKLGIKNASSPTFGVMHELANNFRHYDIYRVESDGFFAKGLHETLEDGWNLIEWSDSKIERFLQTNGFDFIKISIVMVGNKRLIKVVDAI